ncbi:MAG: radical SAM protein [Candidatus Omnitrophica bacterium 4484_70.1]|nr:MAG: radical SAM protein [Candidatus Omnitrophica bacterium 4484_70.1]
MVPSYITLYKQGKLEEIKNKLLDGLKKCNLCPHNCGVNRHQGILGFCKTGRLAKVNSFFLHFGEERELVGERGSGTIFFSYCNLKCVYCQNYTLSHLGEGEEVNDDQLAEMMIILQTQGAENINFVTPTHVLAQIVEALPKAIQKGLKLPLVYNCGGYEKVETLKLIKGIFDIYMPDIKYGNNNLGRKFSSVDDYWDVVKEAVKEIYSQVGDLRVEKGIAQRGLLIRHLVLPSQRENSLRVLEFIKNEISPYTYVNIMNQYYPCYHAYEFDELSRRVTDNEFKEVINYAEKIGLYRGFSSFL